MDLLFLGTSAGTPTRARNVTALALIEDVGKAWYLVDCGEGTQHQLLRTPLSLHDLQAIFITHVHGDHSYGLPGLLASAGMQGRTRPLSIIAPRGIEEWLLATARTSVLTLPYSLHFVATESLGTWSSGNWLIDATPLSHRVPSYAYGFTEANPHSRLDQERLLADGIPRGPLWGRIKRFFEVRHAGRTLRSRDYLHYPHPPRRLVIGGDNDDPSLLAEACRNAQVLVHEATYTQDIADRVKAFGHSHAALVARFAERARLPQLVLTHFSPRYQSNPQRSPSIDDIRREAAAHYSGTLVLAEDFSRWRLDRAGTLQPVPPPERHPALLPTVLPFAAQTEFDTEERCFIVESSNRDDDPQVSIARARVEPGVTTRWHRLRGITERYVILEGRGLVEVGELPPQEVGPGDVVLIPPGCRQRIRNLGDQSLLFLAICSPRFVQEAYEDVDQ